MAKIASALRGCNPTTRSNRSEPIAEARMAKSPICCIENRGKPLKFFNSALSYRGDDCLIWPYAKSHGYGMMRRDSKYRAVHRLVCESIHGAAPSPKHQAAHSCGNGNLGCINPRHLRWATRIENAADTIIHGTHNRGERCANAKLSSHDVIEIRAMAGTMTHKEISKMFGVGRQTVTDIISRRWWNWL